MASALLFSNRTEDPIETPLCQSRCCTRCRVSLCYARIEPEPRARKDATIIGTATDVNGNTIPNATVLLKEGNTNDPRTIVTNENGSFEFHDVKPGIPYQLSISAKGFADWTCPPITLSPDQFKIVTGIQLRIATERTTVDVHYDPVEVATEQLKAEEKQRVFGIIPNFYVSYESDPAPLTARMKFKLALKVSADPVTAAGVSHCSQCQAGRRYSELWARLGSLWKTFWRSRRGWLF